MGLSHSGTDISETRSFRLCCLVSLSRISGGRTLLCQPPAQLICPNYESGHPETVPRSLQHRSDVSGRSGGYQSARFQPKRTDRRPGLPLRSSMTFQVAW